MTLLTGSCAAQLPAAGDSVLSQEQVIDLMENPRRWDGRIVTVAIYPYDNGFQESYLVCFEPCSSGYAESSPFIVYTASGRFRNFRGDRAVVIRARYSSTCFYRAGSLCPDTRFGRFHELPPV